MSVNKYSSISVAGIAICTFILGMVVYAGFTYYTDNSLRYKTTHYYNVYVGDDVYHLTNPKVEYWVTGTRVLENQKVIAAYPERLPWRIEKAETISELIE